MFCAGSDCVSFTNSTNLEVNTSMTSDCTAVAVKCPLAGQRLANMVSVYTCRNSVWTPLPPRSCIDETNSSEVDIGVIVSCAIGASISIIIIIIAIFLIISIRQQAKLDKQRQRILSDRMQRVWEFASSVSRYNSMAELGDGAGESGTTAATTADADTVYA